MAERFLLHAQRSDLRLKLRATADARLCFRDTAHVHLLRRSKKWLVISNAGEARAL